MRYFLFTLLFVFPRLIFAEGDASLFLFPATGTHPIGETFTVSVNVNTGGQSINAVEGKISFNTEELEVAGVSKDGSVLESWITEPSISAEEGTLSFSGAMKNFSGDSGKIFSIEFRALKNTESRVRFSSGAAVLGNDGQGTNILTVMNAGVYTLTAKEVIPVPESIATPPADTPTPMVLGAASSTEQKIVITSQTHPDENKWYNKNTAEFTWALPPDATAVRLLVNSSSSSVPTKLSPAITKKTVSGLDEGVSYFHFRMKTASGWSETVSYRLQVDTERPESFVIKMASSSEPFGFLFDARDKTSGIEKYLVRVDNGAETEWRDDGSHTYIPEPRSPGSYTLFAKAVDFAGNLATSSFAFTLDPIDAPVITEFQEKILPGGALVLRGRAHPNAPVSVWVAKDGAHPGESKVTASSDGVFTFVLNGKAEEGTYVVYAEELGRGVRSAPSGSVVISVSKPGFILFGKTVLDYLAVLIPLITLVLLLVFILAFGWHRFKIFRATLQKEVEEVEAVSRKSFSKLRKEIYEDERILASIGSPEEKIKKEKEVVKRLKKSVADAEEKVEKEISTAKEKVKKSSSKVKAKRVG